MRTIIASIVSTTFLFLATSALSVDMPPEGKAKCGACHAIDVKKVGPSFMDISAKYKDDQDAVGKIAESTAKGGAFGWGMGKMPPKGIGASEAQIKSLSEFIAGLSK